ncbi:hypothetical protein JCM5353_000149 [Sporobolomyces roseus]
MSSISGITQEADSSLDRLAYYFESTLKSANLSLEQRQRHSLTQTSLSSLTTSLDYLATCFPPTPPQYPVQKSTEPSRRPKLSLRTRPETISLLRDQPSPSPSSFPSAMMERRRSWSDPRSLRRDLQIEGSSSGSSSSSEEEEENMKFEQFPPRRLNFRPSYHRRGRSDPGPSSSSSSNSNKRDLRRSLLKRRATLTHRSNTSQSSSSSNASRDEPLPPPLQRSPPRRPRRSLDSPQALRLKTFNFPSTSSSPFLLAPSANSSYSSSASSERSRFSDDSSSEEDESDTSSDGEDGEFEKESGNSFDLELDLFPVPPSPSSSQ